MSETTYNGWTNYETWLVNLWQDNDEGEQAFWQEQAQECVNVDGRESAVRSLSDIMREHYENASADLAGVTGFWTDLLTSALHTVNWREIAQHWIDAIEEMEPVTDEERSNGPRHP